MIDRLEFEKEVWYRVFNEAERIVSEKLRSVDDWPRVKAMLAKVIARVLIERFRTVELIAYTELSGGEYVDDYEGGFDIDLLIRVGSEAEAYALKNLEPIIDNALKEAIVYSKDKGFLRRMGEKYGKGIYHNIVELHVNDTYVEAALGEGPYHPPTILYRRKEPCPPPGA